MSLGASYATLAQLKLRLNITDTNDDAALTSALGAATLAIEGSCGRQFNTTAAANSGATVTYTGTTLVDTAANFISGQVGAVVTSGANTATIATVTDGQHLITSAWAPGTPSAAAAYSIPAVVTARVYYPDTLTTVTVDDFWTSTGLIVALDYSNAGTYTSVITSANYQLEPLNGVVDGTPGWPYYKIRAIQTWYPLWYTSIGDPRTSIQITANWGWSSVPANVVEACLILSEETFKMKDAPFGVAGFSQYGAVRVRENPKTYALLERFVRSPIQVA
jgi:hypothetical protein